MVHQKRGDQVHKSLKLCYVEFVEEKNLHDFAYFTNDRYS